MDYVKGQVSIIIPVYNGGSFLPRCLDSLISQTYENKEIILIDDGSKDNSVDIANAYASKDQRLRVITKPNSGVSDTRNTGIREARGEFIVFSDCDDYVDSEYVEHLVSLMSDDIDMGICGWKKELTNGDIKERCVLIDSTLDKDAAFARLVSLGGPQGYNVGKIFRTDKVISNKVMNDKTISLFEDLVFCCEYVKFCNKIRVNTNYCDYHYVLYDNSSRNASIKSDTFNLTWLSEIKALEHILEIVSGAREATKRVRARIALSSTFYINRMFDCKYEDAALMQDLKKKVRKNIWQAVFSSEGDFKWSMQAFLCAISPKLEYKIKKM